MEWTPTGIHALLLAALLLSVPIAGVSVAAAQSGNQMATQTPTATATPTPASRGDSESEFSYAELKADGPHFSNAPDSVRFGRERMFWLVHWPASATFANPGEDDNWQYLAPGATVGRNHIYLRSIIQERDAESETIHVVAWQKGQREVTRGNTTTTEPVAVNVSHHQQNVNLERGWLMQKIRLGHHDDPVRITMWVDGEPGVRWTFRHHSVATQNTIAINSWGDYLEHVAVDIVAVAIIGAFVVGYAVKKALDRAGRGPYGSYAPWLVGGGIVAAVGASLFYTSLAELAVAAPWTIGIGVVVIFGVILLETYTSGVTKTLFLQPRLEHTTSPTGEDAYDIVKLEAESHTTVRMPRGGVAVIRSGLFAFLARVFGRAAFLETVGWFGENQRTQTRIETDHSKWDDVYLIDPLAEQVIDYEAEGWTLAFPPLDREHALAYITFASMAGIAGLLWHASLLSPFIGFGAVGLAALAWGATPTDGHAKIVPAPTHFRPSYGTIAALIEGYDNAETIEEATDQLQQERVKKTKDVEQQIEQRDASLVREMEAGDIPASIRSEDGHDDVKERERQRNGEVGADAETVADGGDEDGE